MREKQNPRPQPSDNTGGALGKNLVLIFAIGAAVALAFIAGKQTGINESQSARPVPAAAPAAPPLIATPAPPAPVAAKPPAPAPPTPVIQFTDAGALAPAQAASLTVKPEPPAEPKHLALPIAWEEARALMRAPTTVLVDARQKHDYDTGHIPGAVSLPQGSPPTDIEAFKARHSSDQLIIAYCAGEGCSLSKILAEELVNSHGYTSVRYWTGGFREWNEREPNAPLEKSAAAVAAAAPSEPSSLAAPSIVLSSVSAPATPAPSAPSAPPMTWAEAKTMLADIVLVDARAKSDYEAGHIPGAISLPEASTPEEFQSFKSHYPVGRKIVVYCSSTSCPVSKRVADKLMAEHGYTSVWFMAGGYQEWQNSQPKPATQPQPTSLIPN